MINQALSHIKQCARIPSFSSFEERIHPYIESVISVLRKSHLQKIEKQNLAISVSGDTSKTPLVLTAHLDKINHWGMTHPGELPFIDHDEEIEGLLDDSAGLGICLTIAELAESSKTNRPVYILLSEMEESTGLKTHPEWLKGRGKDYTHGMGAEALSRFIIEEFIEPEMIITIDATPLFKGEPGVALYSKWWDMYKQQPSSEQIEVTDKAVSKIIAIDSDVKVSNNTNDYMIYGRVVNRNSLQTIPSLALEPAIFPYHQKNERVFKSDIERVLHILKTLCEM